MLPSLLDLSGVTRKPASPELLGGERGVRLGICAEACLLLRIVIADRFPADPRNPLQAKASACPFPNFA